jgi:hypothetical protein
MIIIEREVRKFLQLSVCGWHNCDSTYSWPPDCGIAHPSMMRGQDGEGVDFDHVIDKPAEE